MTLDHPLDRPVWSALTTRQSQFALGDDRAWQFNPVYAPFAAAADTSPESMAGLATVIEASGFVAVVETETPPPPPGMALLSSADVYQMVADGLQPPDCDFKIALLGEVDAPEMLALARLTKPGPFSTRTHRLGEFFGVRHEGRLVAMAGERMKPTGFTEVSGVCTDPGHRGNGYGAALTRLVADRIQARGETAFLHVMAANTAAIALYEALGFTLRRKVMISVLAPAKT
jgi:predicted GNAT family acetyltransferase